MSAYEKIMQEIAEMQAKAEQIRLMELQEAEESLEMQARHLEIAAMELEEVLRRHAIPLATIKRFLGKSKGQIFAELKKTHKF